MAREQERSGIMAQALDQASEAVAIFTAEDDLAFGEIVFVNEAFVEMTGYPREALIGHSALLLMGKHPERDGFSSAMTRRTRRDGTEYDVEVHVRAIADHYVLTQRAVPAPTGAEGWVRSGFRAASIAVDDVVSELRDAVVELAMLDDRRCDDLSERLGDALEAAADAQEVIGELGMLSRTDAAPRVMDVHEALEMAVRVTRGIVGRAARLVRAYDEVPAVHANPAALARTFAQLIQNAAAAIPPFLPAANSITLRTYEDIDGNVVVEISDTGVGIAEDVVHRVFAGHGLTIARADILAAGGTMSVASVEGRGSRFTVRLPAVGRPAHSLPPASRHDLPLRDVLVACSDGQVARQLRAFFEDERTCVVDLDLEEAAERLARGDTYDLVVCDARDANAKAFRARLMESAPEALMKMFEITADAAPTATVVKKRDSGVRLALVGR